MTFIGIITDQKSENDIRKLLTNNNFFIENNVIFIKEKNIDNIKNVHFDTVVVNRKFEKSDELKKLLQNAKNVIVNLHTNVDNIEFNMDNSNVITYGFNSKSCITISSVSDDDVLIYLQRKICNNYEEIDVQEIKIENNPNYSIYDLIVVLTLVLMYLPKRKTININGIK